MPTIEELREKLKQVYDPEIHMNIVDLGLVYEIKIEQENKACIKMTLTSPACPAGPMILSGVHTTAKSVPGISDVKIDLIWDPPWDPRKMASDDVKAALGIWDDLGGEEKQEGQEES